MANDATAQIGILVQLRDEATDAMRRMSDTVSDLGGALDFAGGKSGILAGALAAIGGSTILSGFEAYADAQATLAEAKGIFDSLPDGVRKYSEAIKAGADAQAKFGFDAEDTTLALAKFARAAGGDMTVAMTALAAAEGFAVDRHTDLNSAVQALLPTFAGGARAVKALGFDVDEHASALTAFQTVVNATKTELEAYSGTLEAQGNIAKAYGRDIMQGIGQPYGEILGGIGRLITGHSDLGGSIEALTPLWNGLGVSIGIVSSYLAASAFPALLTRLLGTLGLLEAGVELTGAAIIAFAATWGLVVLAIAAVIAVGILIYQHWDQVKAFLGATWNEIKTIAVDVWDAIVDFFSHLPERMGQIFGIVVSTVVEAFMGIYAFLEKSIPIIIADIINFFAGLPSAIVSALASLPSMIYNFFSNSIGQIRSLFDGLVSYILGIPGRVVDLGKGIITNSVDFINRFITGFNSSVPDFLKLPLLPVPKLANGGIVSSPTLALIGEAGREAVIPLDRGGGLSGLGGGITINFNGDVFSPAELASVMSGEIARIIKNQVNVPMRA